MPQLTSLANVKAWVNSQNTNDDALLNRLITSASNFILNYIERPNIARTTFNDLQNGAGNQALTLKNWPVIAVSAVNVGNQSDPYLGESVPTAGKIPAQPALGQPGYVVVPNDGAPLAGSPQVLALVGYQFPRGRANVQVTYQAGYCVIGEPATIPASPGAYKLTPACPNGPFLQDDVPVHASNGVAFTKVSALTAAGQYTVAVDATTGLATYTFDAADQGVAVLLNYSYVPEDLENACIEIVGERYRYKGRIGEVSKTMGGQLTASFSQKDMPDYIAQSLNPYRKWFPL